MNTHSHITPPEFPNSTIHLKNGKIAQANIWSDDGMHGSACIINYGIIDVERRSDAWHESEEYTLSLLVSVYVIPGGERASLSAYDDLKRLLEEHPDLVLSVYRGMNRADGAWVITLVGEKSACDRYQEQIERLLKQVQAQLLPVPQDRLAPFIERFLESQAEMAATHTPFLLKHYPTKA